MSALQSDIFDIAELDSCKSIRDIREIVDLAPLADHYLYGWVIAVYKIEGESCWLVAKVQPKRRGYVIGTVDEVSYDSFEGEEFSQIAYFDDMYKAFKFSDRLLKDIIDN